MARIGAGSPLCCGKKLKYLRTMRRHSASSATSRSAQPEIFVCTAEPPISSSVTSSPTAAFTRWRPPNAIDDVPFTIGTKSASAGMYAVPAAQWPSIAATIGTTPLMATCSRNSAPAPANVDPDVDWMRAPAESSSHTNGMRCETECARNRAILLSPTAAHRAGHHREVVRGDGHRPAVDLADAGDRAVGGEVAIAETGVHVIGEQAVLDPRSGVEQEIEAFAHRELAELALAGDAIGAAHLERALPPLREVADERAPVVDVATCGRRRLRPSASLPLRRTLLGEGGDTLGRVLGLRRHGQHPLEIRERGVGVHLEHPVERVAAPTA